MKITFEKLINRLPEDLVNSLKNCEQNPKWHPEGSVYNHTKLVFEYAQKNFPGDNELLLAAIFHDLGKPETSKIVEKNGETKIVHYGHEYASLKYIDKYFELFSDISNNKEKVYEICKNHMKAHLFKDGAFKKPSKIEAFKSNKYFNDIMNFSECDSNGR